MTQAELEVHETKIRNVMIDHLTTVGWPDISNEVIMRELKNMWIKIEEANLKLPGMTFEAFCSHAHNQFMIAEVNGILGI